MAPNAEPNSNYDFLMTVIATCDEFKPNWKKVNVMLGYSRADQPQQKFKKLIESTKRYALVNNKVVDLEDNGDGTANVPSTSTPVKRGRGGKTTTPRSGVSGRKRKATKDDADEEFDGEGTPAPAAKKRATPAKRGVAKKATEKVKAEVKAEESEEEKEAETGEMDDSGGKESDEVEGEGEADGNDDDKDDAI